MSEFEKRDARVRRWLWVCVAVGLVAIGFALWVWIFRPGQVRAELARIRAAGEPVTAEELAAMYGAPPADQDATQRWLDAFASVDAATRQTDPKVYVALPIVGQGAEIPLPGEAWPQQQEVEKFLEQQSEALRLLHEAAGHGGTARFPDDFRQGMNMLLPHVQGLREGARFLVLEAEVCAHTGDVEGAAKSIDAMFATARSVENEPVLVSQLVRAAVDNMAIREVERLLSTMEFADADLKRWQQELRRADYRSGIRRAMEAERVVGVMVREDPASQGITGGQALAMRIWGSADLAFYLKLMRRMVDAGKKPWPEALQAADDVDAELQAMKDPRYVLTQLLLPALGRVYSAGARVTALNRAADAAIAVELYRRRQDALPESLDALVPEWLPEVPADPFDGKPLRYVVSADDYAIYSVGADGKDDGGKEDGRSGKPDVVFRVRRKGGTVSNPEQR